MRVCHTVGTIMNSNFPIPALVANYMRRGMYKSSKYKSICYSLLTLQVQESLSQVGAIMQFLCKHSNAAC